MSLLSQKHLQNEGAADKWVEARIWPNGAQCPHCFEQKRELMRFFVDSGYAVHIADLHSWASAAESCDVLPPK